MDEQEAWCRLLRVPRLRPADLMRHVRAAGSAANLLGSPMDGVAAALATAARDVDAGQVRDDCAWLDQHPDCHLISCLDELYPALLHEIVDAPAALWVRGDPAALWQPMLAVVGSRNPTAGGLDTAEDFSLTIARSGFWLCSGLAIGIDTCAHQAALQAGSGTVAVLATGVDAVYPRRNAGLAQQILSAGGALVSEYPPRSEPLQWRFPRRNRLISGLSLGVLVIEAGLKSGSLITARMAIEQGREVFAVPGSIHNPLARGCHQLIREGARLAEQAGEIIAGLAPAAARLGAAIAERVSDTDQGSVATEPAGPSLAPDAARVFAAIGHDPVSIDELALRTALTIPSLSSILLLLELEGLVDSNRGGSFSRKHRRSG